MHVLAAIRILTEGEGEGEGVCERQADILSFTREPVFSRNVGSTIFVPPGFSVETITKKTATTTSLSSFLCSRMATPTDALTKDKREG